jgi:hypothetical protein
MEACGMKHDMTTSYVGALPDAPLAMPKQELERPSLFSVLRRVILNLYRI